MYGYGNNPSASALYRSTRAPEGNESRTSQGGGQGVSSALYGKRQSQAVNHHAALYRAYDAMPTDKALLAAVAEPTAAAPPSQRAAPPTSTEADIIRDVHGDGGARLRLNYSQLPHGHPAGSSLYQSSRQGPSVNARTLAYNAHYQQPQQAHAVPLAHAPVPAAADDVTGRVAAMQLQQQLPARQTSLDLQAVLQQAAAAQAQGAAVTSLYGRPAVAPRVAVPLAVYGRQAVAVQPTLVTSPQELSGTTAETYVTCDDEMETEETLSKGGDVAMCDSAVTLHGVYMPTIYTDCSSPTALSEANRIMSGLYIPGDLTYMPVCDTSFLFQMGVSWGFTAFSVALGSSYFQRLVQSIPQLHAAVRTSRKYQEYVAYMKSDGQAPAQVVADSGQDTTLQSIQFTCTYLAMKVVDRVPHLEMLRYMLTQLYGALVSKTQAQEVEAKCLEGLGYRLGPYYIEDDLSRVELY